MVVKTDVCAYSGLRIYPGHGIFYVRADQKSFKFINRKSKSQFLQRLNPRKIAWTQLYRRMHKKGTMEESTRKKTRKVSKTTNKAVVGMTLDVIKAKRSQKPEVRAAAREAALREIKERNKAKQARAHPANALAPATALACMKAGAPGEPLTCP
uniref:Large ribosomal subunit protein eL24 n=1 Tax=Seriola lalandi dorsalis TaxID=1841481 RepID=A0A3B4XA74_SERLL